MAINWDKLRGNMGSSGGSTNFKSKINFDKMRSNLGLDKKEDPNINPLDKKFYDKTSQDNYDSLIKLGLTPEQAKKGAESSYGQITPMKQLPNPMGGTVKAESYYGKDGIKEKRKDFSTEELEQKAKQDSIKRKNIFGVLKTELDHITPLFLGGSNEYENLKTVKAKTGFLGLNKPFTPTASGEKGVNTLSPEERQGGGVAFEDKVYDAFNNNEISQYQALQLIKEFKDKRDKKKNPIEDIATWMASKMAKQKKETSVSEIPENASQNIQNNVNNNPFKLSIGNTKGSTQQYIETPKKEQPFIAKLTPEGEQIVKKKLTSDIPEDKRIKLEASKGLLGSIVPDFYNYAKETKNPSISDWINKTIDSGKYYSLLSKQEKLKEKIAISKMSESEKLAYREKQKEELKNNLKNISSDENALMLGLIGEGGIVKVGVKGIATKLAKSKNVDEIITAIKSLGIDDSITNKIAPKIKDITDANKVRDILDNAIKTTDIMKQEYIKALTGDIPKNVDENRRLKEIIDNLGGIKSDSSEELKLIPNYLKRQNGIPLDEIVAGVNAEGGFKFQDGEDLRQSLMKMKQEGLSTKKPVIKPSQKPEVLEPKTTKVSSEVKTTPKQAISEEPLIQEARKYKSAEEFVNSGVKKFHQTSPESALKIEKEGFRTDLPGSGSTDYLPEGINTKSTDAELSIKGKGKQLEVFFPKTTKLKKFENRDEAERYFYYHDKGEKYQSLVDEVNRLDKESVKKADELDKIYYSVKTDNERRAILAQENKILDDYYKKMQEVSSEARKEAMKIAKEEGIDAIHIDKDLGSFNRTTDNTIVINKELLKTKSQLTDIWNKSQPLQEGGSLMQESKKYKTTINIQDKDDLEYLGRILSEDNIKDIKSGKMTNFRGTPYEDLARVNIISETPKTIEQQLSGKIKEIKLKSDTFYHGTSAKNARGIMESGFKRGSDLLEETFRGGGYGKMQNSISLAETPKEASIFSTLTKDGEIVESKLKPNSKIVSIQGVEDANDLDDYIDYLKKQKVDAVYIGGGEKELVVINPKAITPIKSSPTDIWNKANKEVKSININKAINESSNKPISEIIKKKTPQQEEAFMKSLEDDIRRSVANREKFNLQFTKEDADLAEASTMLGDLKKTGVKGFVYDLKNNFENWVNGRSASKVEGWLKKKQFKDIDGNGLETILDFNKDSSNPKYSVLKKYFDDKYQEVKKAGVDLGFKKNYLPLLFKNSDKEVAEIIERKLSQNPSFSFSSVLKDYKEAIDMGLTPKFEKLSDLAGWYERTANKVIADRGFFDYLKNNKLITKSTKAPIGWVELQNLPKFKSKFPEGEYSGNYSAPPELSKVINNYLKNVDEDSLLTKFANYASRIKEIVLSSGIPKTGINAHGFNILARNIIFSKNPLESLYTGSKYLVNPKSAVRKLDKISDNLPFAIRNGLTLKTEADYVDNTFDALKNDKTIRTKIGNAYNKFIEWQQRNFEKPLFEEIIPTLKMQRFNEVFNDLKKSFPEEEAGKKAAQITNEFFGGINYDMLARNKTNQQISRAIFLAPDWLETNVKLLKNVPKSLLKPNSSEMKAYRIGARNIMLAWTGANIANYISSGHFMFQNEPGHTFEIQAGKSGEKNRYIRPFGTALDFIRLPYDLAISIAEKDLGSGARIVRNRLSIPLGYGLGMLTNTDYLGRPIYGKDKYGNEIPVKQQVGNITARTSELFTPQYVGALIDLSSGKSNFEQALLQGLELPTRYSATSNKYYKAQETADKKKNKERNDFMPKYKEIRDLVNIGKEDEASNMLDNLSDEEYTIYKSIKTSEKAKETKKLKLEMMDKYNEIKEFKDAGDIEKAREILDSLSDEEYKAYESLKNELE